MGAYGCFALCTDLLSLSGGLFALSSDLLLLMLISLCALKFYIFVISSLFLLPLRASDCP